MLHKGEKRGRKSDTRTLGSHFQEEREKFLKRQKTEKIQNKNPTFSQEKIPEFLQHPEEKHSIVTDKQESVEEIKGGIGVFPAFKIDGQIYLEVLDANLRPQLCTLEDVIESFKKIPDEPGP